MHRIATAVLTVVLLAATHRSTPRKRQTSPIAPLAATSYSTRAAWTPST